MNALLATIPVALSLVYLAKVPVAVAMAREGSGYDNHLPRAQQARLSGWGERALSAHQNGFESFPAFAASVIAANVAGVERSTALALALTYLGARVVYVGLYLADRATFRSLVWGVGFCATMALFVLAALA